MTAASRPAEVELCVVIPVYGCGPCLRALHARLTTVLRATVESHAIVFVDDRGPDNSWAVLTDLAAEDPAVHAVRLSRNFGQHLAITAGLERSTGRWTVLMDCDLQDPPEEIPRLYAEALRGHDIVFARRKARTHSLARRVAARAYFGLLNRMLHTDLDREYGTFSILSRQVVRSFLRFGERERHYLFILHWLGFDHSAIDVQHQERFEGRSGYSLGRLVRHAIDGVFFQTTLLLRWIVYLGFLLALAGIVLAGFFTYSWYVNTPYPGWTSLAVLILVIGGFIVISTGVAGLYIGKIFTQVKARPLFVVAEEIGAGVRDGEDVTSLVER